jgi:hypothetical protein
MLDASPEKFWNPTGTFHADYVWGKSSLVLYYPELHDLIQIGREVGSVVGARDGTVVYWESVACPAMFPPPLPISDVARELRNRETGEYRLAFSPDERRKLLSDDRWQLTGESFAAPRPDGNSACTGLSRVVRFSLIGDRGLGTEVLTADGRECGGLRTSGDWYLRDIPLHAWMPWEGRCPSFSVSVMRLFNASVDAPNHRYTARPSLYREMIADGWIGEGVAFCVPDGQPAAFPHH